ncbi:ABC transporter ATP-binding protein [bacterium]|nr:ABC transporter ATP-binding protein [bacterium]MDB4795305.1 ABC transporter ATP-binding protein [Verrucomicrobiota bacterium]
MVSPSTQEAFPSRSNTEQAGDVVISVRGLTKVFKDFWGRPKAKAVNNVDFEVKRGEVFGLLGPNGSGKSTTIKMLLGLLYPTKGHIEVFGHSPRHVATKSRIGYLPEESYLYKYLDSKETLDFFGNLFNLNTPERRKRADQLIEMVGLNNARSRQVGEFSKGMQRRIGLAQALINDPDLVILDEPTAGLDPIGCREIKDLIVALAKRGKTIILSSHLLSDVEDVCDRVVIYYGGRIQAQGTLQDLLVEPDVTRITSPVLKRETMDKVLNTIRSEIKDGSVTIDNPTQNLESYFLGVVEKARASEESTSGALAGKVADYLKGTAEEQTSSRDKVLDRLTQIEGKHDAKLHVEAPTEKVDHGKLDQLTHDSSEAFHAPEVENAGKSQADLDAANDKLSSLLDSAADKGSDSSNEKKD